VEREKKAVSVADKKAEQHISTTSKIIRKTSMRFTKTALSLD